MTPSAVSICSPPSLHSSFAYDLVDVAVGKVDAVRLSFIAAQLAILVPFRPPCSVVATLPSEQEPYKSAVIVRNRIAIIIKYDVSILPEQVVVVLVVSGLSDVFLGHPFTGFTQLIRYLAAHSEHLAAGPHMT